MKLGKSIIIIEQESMPVAQISAIPGAYTVLNLILHLENNFNFEKQAFLVNWIIH